jgi:hypothetical protein
VIRNASCLLIVATLVAFAGAQGPKTGLTAAQQQQLFQRNRAMIQTLVESSVEISNQSGDYIKRSQSYRKVIMEFQKELNNAADGTDATRVAELGKHLDMVMRQGLAPNMKKAYLQIGGPNGTGHKDLQEIRDSTIELVDWLQVKAKNKWADTPEVREVIESLEKTKKEMGTGGP